MERAIETIRRECLDHVIVPNEVSLRPTLRSHFDSHHVSRTHLTLAKDSPEPRPVRPPDMGWAVAAPQAGGCTIATKNWQPEIEVCFPSAGQVCCLSCFTRRQAYDKFDRETTSGQRSSKPGRPPSAPSNFGQTFVAPLPCSAVSGLRWSFR